MKNLFLSVLFLAVIFCAKDLHAQAVDKLSKNYETVTTSYSVPDNDQQNFSDVNFRFAWNDKMPTIAVQFANHGYKTRKFKFAIKDITSKKMILLDTVHNSRFGSETLKPNSESAIWFGAVDNIKDSFSLHVWNSDGNEFDKVPIAINDP